MKTTPPSSPTKTMKAPVTPTTPSTATGEYKRTSYLSPASVVFTDEEHRREQARAMMEQRRREKEQQQQQQQVMGGDDSASKMERRGSAGTYSYTVLTKKLQKVEAMLLQQRKNEDTSSIDYSKLDKKRQEYKAALEQTDEWKEEQAALQQRQAKAAAKAKAEAEKKEHARNAAARKRELEQEQERKEKEHQKALELEARQRRQAEEKEEVRRKSEEAEKEQQRQEEALHRQKIQEAEIQRQKELAQQLGALLTEPAKLAVEEVPSSSPPPVTTTTTKSKTTEATQEFLDRRALQEPYSENTKRILRELELVENRHKTLERQLGQNGLVIAEEIPYDVAKAQIVKLTEQIMELKKLLQSNGSEGEEKDVGNDHKAATIRFQYYKLEEEMEKYSAALMITEEYAQDQAAREQEWEKDILNDNVAALQCLRRHMPVMIRHRTEEELTTQPTPNGKVLPKIMVRKFKRSNILQLLRIHPDVIERMHPSLLEGLRTIGLTLTERRALYEHLKYVGSKWEAVHLDKTTKRKWIWYESLKLKFMETLNIYNQHVEQYGPPSGGHNNNDHHGRECPLLGNQCPFKADKIMDYSDDYGFSIEADYEPLEAPVSTSSDESSSSWPLSSSSENIITTPTSSNRFKTGGTKRSDDVLLATVRRRAGVKEPLTDEEEQLLKELVHEEKRSLTMERQLIQAGITIVKEDIPYSVAKEKVQELTADIKAIVNSMGNVRMSNSKELSQLEQEYIRLSQELETYTNAMMLTKEWVQDQHDREQEWEDRIQEENRLALYQLRRHMPVNIRDMSEEQLMTERTPNGKMGLSQVMVRKFKRTNILLLLRINPIDIEPMHPSSLEALRTTGLTLTERRALYEHLKELGPKWKLHIKDKMTERKWIWYESFKQKFRDTLDQYQTHVDQYGPPTNHPYYTSSSSRGTSSSGGCPMIGNQCPCKANTVIDYSGDYGFPIDNIYYESATTVQKSNLLSVEDFVARNNNVA